MPASGQSRALRAPGSATSFGKYLRSVWTLRSYAWRNGKNQVRSGNAGTSLGALWLFLEPVFSIAIYWVIFGVLLDVSRGVDNFLAFLTVGQVTFGLSQRAMLGASASLTIQAPMMRALAFPRALLPISAVLKAFAAYRVELVVMLFTIWLMGETPRVGWLFLPLVAVLQAATSLGLGLALARIVFVIPDLQRFATHLMRLAFYGSGVFFPLQAFTENKAVLIGATLNPFFDFVELARWATISTTPPYPALTIVSAIAWSVVTLLLGGWFFHRAEHTYAGARTVSKDG